MECSLFIVYFTLILLDILLTGTPLAPRIPQQHALVRSIATFADRSSSNCFHHSTVRFIDMTAFAELALVHQSSEFDKTVAQINRVPFAQNKTANAWRVDHISTASELDHARIGRG